MATTLNLSSFREALAAEREKRELPKINPSPTSIASKSVKLSGFGEALAAERERLNLSFEDIVFDPSKHPRLHGKFAFSKGTVPNIAGRQGSSVIKKKYDVVLNGKKVGEIRHVQHRYSVKEGRLHAGWRNDFAEYQVHEGDTTFPKHVSGIQQFDLKGAKDAAIKHFELHDPETAAIRSDQLEEKEWALEPLTDTEQSEMQRIEKLHPELGQHAPDSNSNEPVTVHGFHEGDSVRLRGDAISGRPQDKDLFGVMQHTVVGVDTNGQDLTVKRADKPNTYTKVHHSLVAR